MSNVSKLQAALAWAARGFPVFPLMEGGKEPAFDTWVGTATTDPDTIRRIWTDPVLGTEREYNIGFDCTNFVVIDIDNKFGKDGHNQYVQLGGTYETLVVRTPSGGFHCYFEGPDSANIGLSRDVDVRSHNGYVVAPGSYTVEIPGEQVEGWYEVVTDREPAWVPLPISERLAPAYIRGSGGDTVALDNPASIQAGINFLQTTAPAIEGQRGDETTFVTAARLVREMALSVETAFQLMCEHWNERCQPPWQLDELRQKVENAANYGSAEFGRLDPTVVYAGVHVEPPPGVIEQSGALWTPGRAVELIRPRPWLVDGLFLTGYVTLIGAAGSAGKSSVSLLMAALVVQGLDFAGRKTHKACKAVVWNGEDDVEEQERRLLAICDLYGFDYQYVRSRIMLLSSEEVDLKLVSFSGQNPTSNEALINELVNILSDPEVGFAVLDPFVDLYFGSEADPNHTNTVMGLLKSIAKRADIALLIMHHTTKASGEKQEDRVGNMDILRGSSGIANKARIILTLMGATSTDVETYGLQEHERHTWVRLDDAKTSMTLKDHSRPVAWFHKEGVKIVSGDVVGVFRLQDLSDRVGLLRLRVAEIFIQTMQANGTGSMILAQAVNVLKANEPIFANQKDNDVKHKLEGMFATAYEVRGHTLKILREAQEGKGDKLTLVLT